MKVREVPLGVGKEFRELEENCGRGKELGLGIEARRQRENA